VIARGTLNQFVKNKVEKSAQAVVKGQLDAWYAETARASWRNSSELKRQYASASIISSERVVFNIKGNDYRLVTAISYRFQIVLIIWIGTHKEYDKIVLRRCSMTKAGIRVRPIRSENDHDAAVARIAELIGAKPGTPEGDELDVLATLVDAWETKHHPMDAPDPIAAIQFRMEQQGLTRKDLEPLIGSRARVSEVLRGKRELTIEMVRRVRSGLGISADLLIGPRSSTRRRARSTGSQRYRVQRSSGFSPGRVLKEQGARSR
jgi:HTH-type transcriptional regulator/antitoxin HigA